MKKVFIILMFLLGFNSTINSQWLQAQNGLPSNWTSGWAVGSVDDQTCFTSLYILGQSPLYKTVNSGINWTSLNIPQITIGGITDIAVIDENNLWLATGYNGKILQSSDGGSNWNIQYENTPLQTEMCYIEFFDPMNGVALGNIWSGSTDCMILKTTNGGANWEYSVNNDFGGYSGDKWNRIDFVNSSVGYFFPSGKSPASIYKTVDGGVNWNTTNFPGDNVEVLKFSSENYGAANNGNKIFVTKDGGNSWTETILNDEGWGMDIEFVPGNPQMIYFTEMYNLFFSPDSGNTWDIVFEIPAGSQEYIRDIEFNDEDHGWMICDNGKFYKITNASQVVSVTETVLNNPLNFSLEQNYPNPFNPGTTIKFTLPQNEFVKVKVFNQMGEEVALLVNGQMSSGTHSIDFDGSELASGIYFYQISAGKFNEVKKMMLLK